MTDETRRADVHDLKIKTENTLIKFEISVTLLPT